MLWLATCAAAVMALWSVEEPRFDPPPSNPGAWSQWASGRDVLDATAGISRLLATAALGYLLLVSVAHLFALAWGPTGLHRFTARLSPKPVAALAATAVLGGSPLAAAMGTSGGPPAGGDDPVAIPAPVMRVVEDDGPQSTTTSPAKTPPTTDSPVDGPPADKPRGGERTAEPNPEGATAPPPEPRLGHRRRCGC
ncbi:MAG: hypothetical protein M5U19_08270 [Microthrixaceae bacterium]|nr:hypothetical protein [Microthrixaceae bacterium]